MKKSLILFLVLFVSVAAFARTNSKLEGADTELGNYGIPYYSDINKYQSLVGVKVMYLSQYDDGKRIYDKHFKGEMNVEYIISKVSVKNEHRVEVELTPANNPKGKKVKMFINNFADNSYSSYRTIHDKEIFCATKDFTTPLLLVDKFNSDKESFKVNGIEGVDNTKLIFEDLVLERPGIGDYPKPFFVFKNVKSGEIYKWTEDEIPSKAKLFNDIGKTFSDPSIKPIYTVSNIIFKNEYIGSYTGKQDIPYYVLTNNISDKEVTCKVSYANSEFKKLVKEIHTGHYRATLKKVEKPSNSAVRYGKTTEVTSDKNITKYSYVDNFIDILIFAGSKEFDFELKNVSENTLKVVWNEAVYVDYEGNTSKVMHKGIKYSQRDGDQPASTIIKGAKIDDLAAPTDKVYYNETLKEWTSYELFPVSKQLEGKEVRLMLPIQVKEVINEYTFIFELKYVLNYPDLLVQ